MKKMKKTAGLLLAVAMTVTMMAGMFATTAMGANDCSLTIHKRSLTDMSLALIGEKHNGKVVANPPGKAIAGIDFTIRKVKVKGVADSLLCTINGVDYAVDGAVIGPETTDVNGAVKFDNLPEGLYLVHEVFDGTKVAETIDDFIVQLPHWIEEDAVKGIAEEDVYDVHVYPKNNEIVIEKWVQIDGNLDANVGVLEPFKWIIASTIPKSIKNATSYVVTDELDASFEIIKVAGDFDVVVKAQKSGFADVLLTKGTDYTLAYSSATDNKLTVSLTPAGMTKVDTYKILRIEFNTKLVGDFPVAKDIENDAELDYKYKNKSDVTMEVNRKSKKSKVHTGGINIEKLDEVDESPLAGVEFTVYEAVPNGENFVLGAATSIKETTDADGKASFVGLPYGDALECSYDANTKSTKYFLVETSPLPGYKACAPVLITIDKNSYKAAATVVIYNAKGMDLPETGGMGTIVFVVIGVVLLGIAVMVLMSKKKAEGNA